MAKDTYSAVLDELMVLTTNKRAGYSPGDDPFKNFRMSKTFGVDPVVGILIRVMDKIARVASLLQNPDNDKVGESIRETLLDAGNYLLIAVAYGDAEKQAARDDDLDNLFAPVDDAAYFLREMEEKLGVEQGSMGLIGSDGHDPRDCETCARFGIISDTQQQMIYEQDRVVTFDTSQANAEVGVFDSSENEPPDGDGCTCKECA